MAESRMMSPIGATVKPHGPAGNILRWRRNAQGYVVLETHMTGPAPFIGWIEVPFVEESDAQEPANEPQ